LHISAGATHVARSAALDFDPVGKQGHRCGQHFIRNAALALVEHPVKVCGGCADLVERSEPVAQRCNAVFHAVQRVRLRRYGVRALHVRQQRLQTVGVREPQRFLAAIQTQCVVQHFQLQGERILRALHCTAPLPARRAGAATLGTPFTRGGAATRLVRAALAGAAGNSDGNDKAGKRGSQHDGQIESMKAHHLSGCIAGRCACPGWRCNQL